MMREGGAVTMLPAGTLVITTAFGPITTSSPMLIGPASTAPAPTFTRSPSRGAPRRVVADAAGADGDPLADQAVVADHRPLVDDDAVLVRDAEAPADLGGGIELDPVEVAHEEARGTRDQPDRRAQDRRAEPVAPDPEAIGRDRLEARGEEGPLQPRAAVGGIVLAQEAHELAERRSGGARPSARSSAESGSGNARGEG